MSIAQPLQILLKRFRPGPYELCMFILVLLGTAVRFVLIAANWPVTNSDEGNMGLLAMHVAFRGEWPIFFYGLPYMGPVEGYIAAPLFHLFGVSLFSLRLGMLPIFALFVIAMYFLTRMLYSRPFALLIAFLLCTGATDILSREVKVVGEYPETELFAALICLIVAWLALASSPHSSPIPAQERRKRIALYALLGLITGIALWVDFLILPFVGTGLLLLFLFCRRELRSWSGISLLLGVVIGMFPLLIYNVTAPLNRNSLAVLLDIHHSGAALMAAQHLPWIRQLSGATFISLPLATGLDLQCPQEAYPLFGPFSQQMLYCTSLQGTWAIGYIALWSIATVFAAHVLWQGKHFLLTQLRLWRPKTTHDNDDNGRQSGSWTFEERQQLIRQCARLMLLISAAGTWLLYALSPVAATVPAPTSRYLIGMFVALPAVLWPLWFGITQQRPLPSRLQPRIVLCLGTLLLISTVFFVGTIRTFVEVPSAQNDYRQEGELVDTLLRLNATRIYSEYWTCNRLTFRSQEHIICAALNEDLTTGFDRYAPYRDMVQNAANPAYVFPLHSTYQTAFEHYATSQHIAYQRYILNNYAIYLPANKTGLPLQRPPS